MTRDIPRGFPPDFPAPAPAGGNHTAPVREADGIAATLTASGGQEKIARLLGDSVNLLLIVGLQLASVRCRMEEEQERMAIERVTEQLDTALVEIRHLSVRLALGAREDSPEWIPTAGPPL